MGKVSAILNRRGRLARPLRCWHGDILQPACTPQPACRGRTPWGTSPFWLCGVPGKAGLHPAARMPGTYPLGYVPFLAVRGSRQGWLAPRSPHAGDVPLGARPLFGFAGWGPRLACTRRAPGEKKPRRSGVCRGAQRITCWCRPLRFPRDGSWRGLRRFCCPPLAASRLCLRCRRGWRQRLWR